MTMKQNKYILLLSLAIMLGGCTGGFEDLNENPNKITIGGIAPSSMLEPILMTGTNTMMGNTWAYSNEIAQVTVASASNVREEHRYNLSNSNFLEIWRDCFYWATQANHMHKLATEQNNPNYQAIALTMKVYYLQTCTDLFGSIAYTEALKADEGILKPKIESQKDVYLGMIADLEMANSLFNTNIPLADSGKDRLYGGNMMLWKKFTNSLHLRLLMRVSGRNNDFTPSVGDRINTIISNPDSYPIIESNEESAMVKYPGGEKYHCNKFNTRSYTTENGFSGSHLLSERFLNLTVFDLDGKNIDPRIKVWGKPRPANKYKWMGAISGCTKDYGSRFKDKESYMHYETLVRDDNPNHLISYDEVLFIKSEAAFNGWITGTAEEYYNQAITASCLKWAKYGEFAAFPENGTISPVTITNGDINKFIASEQGRYNGTMQRIAEQKWISLFWVVGFEMYSEMRRTGYPNCVIGKGIIDYNYTNGKFIARWGYPTVAIANNYDNYNAALQDMGGSGVTDNTMMLPIWWSGEAISKSSSTPWPHAFRTLEQGDK